MSALEVVDPMLVFVQAYRLALKDLDDMPEADDDLIDAFMAERIIPLSEEAASENIVCNSLPGAIEALRLGLWLVEDDDEAAGCGLLEASLAFFDARMPT